MSIADNKARQRAELDHLIAERRRAVGDLNDPLLRRPRVGVQPPRPWPRPGDARRRLAEPDEAFGAFAWCLVQLTGLVLLGLVFVGVLGWRLGWWLA
jgi:hypothetical protein